MPGLPARFLTAALPLGQGRYRIDGGPRMRQRPIGPLLDGLRQLGVDARDELGTGCPPVVVQAEGVATSAADTHHVRVYMAQLRHKLERDPARPSLLLTEPGVGYRLREEE